MKSHGWRDKELEHLSQLWDDRPESKVGHSKQQWNERAKDWDKSLREDEKRQKRSRRRISETAKYLLERGVITPETEMIDIGCGPGRFVAEFAKYAKHSAGLDISDEMAKFGEKFCQENGLTNTSFIAIDFKNMDPVAEGFFEKYDFVFSSITPAIGYRDGYRKAMLMTKKWFFNACFIHLGDSIQKKLSEEFEEVHVSNKGNGSGFYCMVNELLLSGYYPELTYFREEDKGEYTIEEAFDEYIQFVNDAENPEVQEKVKKALERQADENGIIKFEKEWVYAWMLVDKTKENVR